MSLFVAEIYSCECIHCVEQSLFIHSFTYSCGDIGDGCKTWLVVEREMCYSDFNQVCMCVNHMPL